MLLETKWQPKRLVLRFIYGDDLAHQLYRMAKVQCVKYFKITTEEGDREIKLLKNLRIDLLDEVPNLTNEIDNEINKPTEDEDILKTAIKLAEMYNIPIRLEEDKDC